MKKKGLKKKSAGKKRIKKKKLVPKKKSIKKTVKAKGKVSAKVKKAAKQTAITQPAKPAGLQLEEIGEITHYFPHVAAGVIKLTKSVALNDRLYIKGHTTDFKQKITSMQINRVPVETAKPGDEIGILVDQRVRGGDKVYRI